MNASDLQIVIMSRRRQDSCAQTLKLFPSADICIAHSEEANYQQLPAERIVLHPDEVTGMGAVRHWITSHYKQRCVVIADDDITGVFCMVGRRLRKIRDPAAIFQILLNSAEVTDGIGASLFCFAMSSNVIGFVPHDPFRFLKSSGGVLGFVGRRVVADPQLPYSTDCDLSLQALLKDRILFQDTRFRFEHHDQDNTGGARPFTSPAVQQQIARYMKRKWGRYCRETRVLGRTVLAINHIKRRQKIQEAK